MNTIQKLAAITVLPIVLVLSGCAVGASTTSDPAAVKASQPAAATVPTTQKHFGEVVTYNDGVSVSVSEPAEYAPSAYAAGPVAGQTNLLFNVTITNGSKVNVDVAGFPTLNSGGEQALSITDIGGPQGDVGSIASTTLLPTQSITFKDAYSVKDPSDLTYMYAPAYTYKQAIFTK